MNTSEIKKLEAIYDVDQDTIKSFRAGKISSADLEKINLEHTSYVRDIISKYGFPSKDKTSERAYTSAFLVVQHSGDVELLADVIGTFEKADSEQIDRQHIAYLVDRLRVLKGQPQLYGTQFKKQSDGSIQIIGIEDENNLDKRRAQLGLDSFEEYRKRITRY